MKVLHLISGGETGGSKNHLLSLLQQFPKDQVVLGVFQTGKMYDEALQLGIKVELFNQKSRYDIGIIKRLMTFIKKGNFNIVHTHGPRANLMGSLLKKFMKFCWIITVHSDPRDDFIRGGLKGTVFTNINMNSLKKADHYFAVSNRFKKMLVSFGIKEDKISTIYNGITFDRKLNVNPESMPEEINKDDFVVTMIARLHPIKGHEVVFDAMEKLIYDENKKVKLLLVGDGPIKGDLQAYAAKRKITDNTLFFGFQTDVHSILCQTDVKLLASYSESFPLVILESARAHTPVISTDVGGVKDLISNKELGWIVPIKESDAIKNAILEAMEMKETGKLKIIGDNLYEKASKNYSLDQLYESTLRTYKLLQYEIPS